MKILGISEVKNGHSSEVAYIVEITRNEICKVANKATYREKDGIPYFKVGDTYPIDEGYNFREEIITATNAMIEAHAKFAKASQTMAHFVRLLPDDPES